MTASSAPTSATTWVALPPADAAALVAAAPVRWWLSGGAALDQWIGRAIRPRRNSDVSVVAADLPDLVRSLPSGFSAWIRSEESDELIPLGQAPAELDPQPVLVHDDARGVWVLRINAEDGTDRAWVYKRDPRLRLPWERAVLEIDGIPTGAPEVQLVWKALRPRPQDDADKDAVVPQLSDEARAWWEKAILTIHPHSSWAIHVRSPFAPGKASWNRSRRR